MLLAVSSTHAIRQIYILPHSHCDAGWLLNADQYFAYDWPGDGGASGSVRSALDTITESLAADPTLRFNWAETIWFHKWWHLQSAETQATVRRLVDAGQLSFVGGGWVQNDETLIPYTDVVDQVTTGHEFLRKTLNFTVQQGWQLDMFTGYTGVTPSLWALMGYSEMVTRWAGPEPLLVEYSLDQKFEYVWQASKNLPVNQSEIFAHIINGNYGDLMGHGFDWEGGSVIITNETVEARAAAFSDFIYSAQCLVYRGPCMLLWGNDFHFHDAQAQFSNMTLLFAYLNANQDKYGFHVQFATATEYFEVLHATDIQFPLMQGGDFEYGWPHGAGDYGRTTYQTGATASWEAYKRYIRFSDSLARAAEMTYVLAKLQGSNSIDRTSNITNQHNNKNDKGINGSDAVEGVLTADLPAQLDVMRRFRGLVQHHDSVPGTMRTNVSLDSSFYIGKADVLTYYWSHLDDANDASTAVLTASLAKLTAIDENHVPKLKIVPEQETVDVSSNQTVVVHNSLPWQRQQDINIRVSSAQFILYDNSGIEVPYQIVDATATPLIAVFVASLPPLGFTTYFVLPAASTHDTTMQDVVYQPSDSLSNFDISNDQISVSFSGSTGLISSVSSNGVQIKLSQEPSAYINGTGGAYILFEPHTAYPLPKPFNYTITRGAVFEQVCQHFEYDYNSICVRLYQSLDQYLGGAVLVLNDVGPVVFNHEPILRFSSDLDTRGAFYIDESAMEMHEKIYDPLLGIPGNYHALISSTYIRDNSTDATTGRQLAIISDHTMGTTSIEPGQVEVMMLRNTNFTDDQGPYPLNDVSRVNNPLLLVPGTIESSEALRPRLIQQHQNMPIIFTSGMSFDQWNALCRLQYTGLQKELPPNIDLMTLSVLYPAHHDRAFTFRLRHMFEIDANPILSQPVTIDLSEIFAEFDLHQLTPTTLSLQTPLSALERRYYPYEKSGKIATSSQPEFNDEAAQYLTIGPVEMPSFTFA